MTEEETRKTTVTGVEMFRKLLDRGEAGDNVGALLRVSSVKMLLRGRVRAPGQLRLIPSLKLRFMF